MKRRPNDESRSNAAAETRSEIRGTVRSIDLRDDRMDSRDLFIGTREIVIQHGADSYRLRLTAQNKLILTK